MIEFLRRKLGFLKYKSEKGVIIVATAILLPVLLAFTGIAFDIGRLYVEKGRMQHMADAAVLAGLSKIREHQFYKEGSGKLSMTIPIGALPYDEEDTRHLREEADALANNYLLKNSGDSFYQFGNGGAKSELYFLRNSDIDADSKTFYYEVVCEKTFPLTFGRIVYGKDITVRAGAVCVFHLVDEASIYTYQYALEHWSKLSKEELERISSSYRLKVDREAFTTLGNILLGKDATFLNRELGTDRAFSNNLFGHYEEKEVNGEVTCSYTPNNGSVPGKTLGTKFMDWLQGNENGIGDFDTTKRYLFSDYAINNKDGFKITIKINNNQVSSVKIQTNPGDAANGSGALEINLP